MAVDLGYSVLYSSFKGLTVPLFLQSCGSLCFIRHCVFLERQVYRLVWSCMWPLGPMIRLLGSQNCDAASPVDFADVGSLCNNVYLLYFSSAEVL